MTPSLAHIEAPGPGRLSIGPRPRGGAWLEDEVRSWRRAGVEVVASLLTDEEIRELDLAQEEELSHAQGIVYLSLPIEDRSVPRSRQAAEDFLNRLERALVEGKGVFIHCRQGIGRAALVAATLLVMSGITPAEAFQRISRARGCPVPETAEQRAWVDDFARRSMMPAFHDKTN